MGSTDVTSGAALATITCDHAFGNATLDASNAYRDLTPFRILISLEADGWHIDYEFKNPRLQGGGPHYLIDPADGRILAKRYEQ